MSTEAIIQALSNSDNTDSSSDIQYPRTMAENNEGRDGVGEDAQSQHGDNTLLIDPGLRPLCELLAPERNITPSCITIPRHIGNFHFRNGMIPLLPTFHGIGNERAYLHIREFEEVCGTFADQTCPFEIVRLKLFPFSLKEKAKAWLLSLRPGSINSWQSMNEAFLKKFYPKHLTTSMMRQIKLFSQKDQEPFFEVWERFKDLLLSCPQHGFEK